MKNKKVLIVSVLASDQKALTSQQAKLNQWITTGLLVKYEIHTTGEYVVFNICMNKQEEEPPF
jgi:hypothetical protein